MWKRRNPPHVTDRHGRSTIDDFPLVPEPPVDIRVHALAPTHVEHLNNATESEPLAQPSPQQARPPVPPARETIIPLPPLEATQGESIEDESSDVEAQAAALLAQLRATEEPVEPARSEPRRPKKKSRPQRRSRARRPQQTAPPAAELSPRDYHESRCSICNHPERDAIEEEFLHWYAPSLTASHFNVGWRALYRHAHATGLYAARERNLRSALGHIVENACHITPTVDGVLRAIRAYSCLNRDGQWTEPPAHVVVSSGSRITGPPAAIAVATATLELPASSVSHPELSDNENK
jgi:hypothetical protein